MGKFEAIVRIAEREVLGAYPKTKDFYELRRIRKGKTAKDRANGAHANRLRNRDARNEWCNNRNAKANAHPSGNK